MKHIAVLMFVLMIGVLGVEAQTATPTPTATNTPAPSPSYTPFPTWQWATLTQIPMLSLTPNRLFTPTPPTPGEAFYPGISGSYLTSVPDPNNPQSQITTINESMGLWLTFNIVMISVSLWIWFGTNFRNILLVFRLVLIIVFIVRVAASLMKTIRQWEEKRK